ncbi:MAG: hypothetical protein P9M14_06655 [Candidatus Alcyoniella australis]|nr:hypothetical protein [Candidatus Alcyoniella australis]
MGVKLTCHYCRRERDDVRTILLGTHAEMVCSDCLRSVIEPGMHAQRANNESRRPLRRPSAHTLEEVEDLLSEGRTVPWVDLRDFEIDVENILLVPETICREYLLIPLGRIEDTLIVAMADDSDIAPICAHLRYLTGYDVEPTLGDEESILQLIERVFS